LSRAFPFLVHVWRTGRRGGQTHSHYQDHEREGPDEHHACFPVKSARRLKKGKRRLNTNFNREAIKRHHEMGKDRASARFVRNAAPGGGMTGGNREILPENWMRVEEEKPTLNEGGSKGDRVLAVTTARGKPDGDVRGKHSFLGKRSGALGRETTPRTDRLARGPQDSQKAGRFCKKNGGANGAGVEEDPVRGAKANRKLWKKVSCSLAKWLGTPPTPFLCWTHPGNTRRILASGGTLYAKSRKRGERWGKKVQSLFNKGALRFGGTNVGTIAREPSRSGPINWGKKAK